MIIRTLITKEVVETQIFCDKCGKNISNCIHYHSGIYNHIFDEGWSESIPAFNNTYHYAEWGFCLCEDCLPEKEYDEYTTQFQKKVFAYAEKVLQETKAEIKTKYLNKTNDEDG